MMTFLRICLVFASSFSLLSGSAQAAESSDSAPPVAEIQALIDQLGDDSFQARESAMAKLIQVGPLAEQSIQAALDAPDLEVAYRAKKILEEIDRNLIQKRRDAFLAGDVDQLKTNAASWRRMEKLVGNTRESRELFARMQASGEQLLTTVEQDPKRFGQEVVQLYALDQQMRRFGGRDGLPTGVVAAMVLLGSDESVALDATAVSRCISLLYRYRESLGENQVFKKLLGQWIDAKATGTQQYQLLKLAQLFELDEGLDLARKLVGGGGSASYKAKALLTIGRQGGEEDLELLEKLVENNTGVGSVPLRGNKRIECRLGDVALAMAIALTDQKAKDYGFPNAPNGRPSSSIYYNYGFVDDNSRQAAREKWRVYAQQQ